MMAIPTRFSLVAVLPLIAVPVAAHHSSTMYDQARTVTLRGVITNFEWANPHVYIEMQTDQNGSGLWLIEASPPYVMSKRGWSAGALSPGDVVTVTGAPSRDPDRRMALGHLFVKADGTRLVISDPDTIPSIVEAPAASFVADGLSGYWLRRSNFDDARRILGPEPSPAFTEKGNAAIASYDGSENPSADCVPWPAPYIMVLPLLMSIEIGDEITIIRFEAVFDRQGSVARSVHMNMDSHEGASYTNQGHSIGWWEDDVLVVDTTHFADHRNGHGYGLPSGPRKHVVERFELNSDRTGMSYTFWVEDPEYLAEPRTVTFELVYRPDLDFPTVPCDPSNARRFLEE